MKSTAANLVICFMILLASVMGTTLDEALKGFKDELVKNINVCFVHTNTNQGDMIQFYKDMKTGKKDINNSTKCFMSCMMQTFRVMDEEGNLNMDKLKQHTGLIQNTDIRSGIVKDLDVMGKHSSGGADPCEKAFLFVASGYNNLVENKQIQAVITTAKNMASELMKSFVSDLVGHL